MGTRGFFYDPISDNPLDSEMEGLITMIGERRYLKALVQRFGIKLNFNPDDESEHDCRKVIRTIMRNASDYNGPEMKQ